VSEEVGEREPRRFVGQWLGWLELGDGMVGGRVGYRTRRVVWKARRGLGGIRELR
jgi:hypothetical protein